jgi:thiol-disulfide isomerase/thioredoxin
MSPPRTTASPRPLLAIGLATVLAAPLVTACGSPARPAAGRGDAPAGASAGAAGAGPEGGVAAPVSFADLAGIQSSLKSRRGRPLFVNFWATWCAPCLEEMPLLAKLARESAAAGPEFIGISVDAWVTGEGAETEAKVRRALADAGVVYANLIYRGDQDPLVNAFRLPGPIPYSVLYDRDGHQAGSWVGPIEAGALRSALAGLR